MIKDKKASGFTLVEIITTIVLILIIAVATLPFMVYAQRLTPQREARLIAANFAYGQIEHLRETGKASLGAVDLQANGGANHNCDLPAVALPAGYAITYVIADGYWTEDPLNKPTNANNTSVDYKTITVTCTYPGNQTLTMTGYVVAP